MNFNLQQIFRSLTPFIIFGIAIALAIGLLIFFSYVLVWGILIGGMIWLLALIKNYFSPRPPLKNKQGRIIEHDDRNHDSK